MKNVSLSSPARRTVLLAGLFAVTALLNVFVHLQSSGDRASLLAQVSPVPQQPQCADRIDNDNDGAVDFTALPSPDSIGLYDRLRYTFYLKYKNETGNADLTMRFGTANSQWSTFAGDWNKDGIDTVGLFIGSASTFYLKTSNGPGTAMQRFSMTPSMNRSKWLPVAGDWDNDGTDTVGLYDPKTSIFYLKNKNVTGNADLSFPYGVANKGWMPVAGDWDNDGTDTVGLYDPKTSIFYLKNTNVTGGADVTFGYGSPNAGWLPVAGRWKTIPADPQCGSPSDPNEGPDLCGNGILDASEQCDDRNVVNGDGCSMFCAAETGYICIGSPSVCRAVCGDGVKTSGEQCESGIPCPVCLVEPCPSVCNRETCTCSVASSSSSSAAICYTPSDCPSGLVCSTLYGICNHPPCPTGTNCPPVCSGTCVAPQPAICGNGLREEKELCDDGNITSGDGCSNTCSIESGFTCTGTQPSVCQKCGNGKVEGTEACDDNNTTVGDGCSNTCQVEPGYVCSGTPSVCRRSCGNGLLNVGEQCDDGNTTNSDGCSATCTMEPGYVCSGMPSVCRLTCGNGILDAGEQCDDGNLIDHDGCNHLCKIDAVVSSSSSSSSSSWQNCPTGYMCGVTVNTSTNQCVQMSMDCYNFTSPICDDGSCGNGGSCSGRCCRCPPPSSSSSSSSSSTPISDLSVIMSAPSTVSVGRNIAYTVMITNAGPDNERSASILAHIPDGLVYAPQNSDAVCVQQGTNILCPGLSVTSGTVRGVTLTFSVPSNFRCNGTIQNNAIVMGRNSDRNFSNNFSPWVSTIAQCSSSSSSISHDPVCGNGMKEGYEQCEKGIPCAPCQLFCNTSPCPPCLSECNSQTCMCTASSASSSSNGCGNGRLEADEGCERGIAECSPPWSCDYSSCHCFIPLPPASSSK